MKWTIFWACPKKRCLLPALNSRGKWTPRAVALLHYSTQTVLALPLNPTWALGSAAQLSLFLALHCIITRSSLHSLPRLCTTPLHCSITRTPLSQLFSLLSPTLQPSGWNITACTALLPSPVLHATAQQPPWSPTSLLKALVFLLQHFKNPLALPPPSSALWHSPVLEHQISCFLLCSFQSIPGCNSAEASPRYFFL